MGLEYILSKGGDRKTIEIIAEIFNPRQMLGEQDFSNLEIEDQFELLEDGSVIPYLDKATVSEIRKFLDLVSEQDIIANYNSKELNDNGIYPNVWHNDNSPDRAYNQRQIVEDFIQLKIIFEHADDDENFI